MRDYNQTRELADRYAVETSETTTGRNGYPENLNLAITGFDTITELIQAHDELKSEGFDVDFVELTQKQGWSLWNRTGVSPTLGMYAKAGEQEWSIDFDPSKEEAEDVAYGVVAEGREIEDYKMLEKLLRKTDQFKEELESFTEKVTVFYDPNNDYSIEYVVSEESTSYSEDVNTTKLGLIVDFEQETD